MKCYSQVAENLTTQSAFVLVSYNTFDPSCIEITFKTPLSSPVVETYLGPVDSNGEGNALRREIYLGLVSANALAEINRG